MRRPAIFGDASDWCLVIHWSNIRCSGLLSRSTCTLHTFDLDFSDTHGLRSWQKVRVLVSYPETSSVVH